MMHEPHQHKHNMRKPRHINLNPSSDKLHASKDLGLNGACS